MLVRVLTELLLDIATHFSRITYMPNLTLTLSYWVVNSYEKNVLVHYVSSIRTPSFYVLKVCPLVTPHPLEALRYYEEGSLGPLHRRFDKMGLVALVLLNNTISSLAAVDGLAIPGVVGDGGRLGGGRMRGHDVYASNVYASARISRAFGLCAVWCRTVCSRC